MNPDKPRFANSVGMKVAAELCALLKPGCDRIVVAGSLRRKRPTVGDVEIVYIPKIEDRPDPNDLFARKLVNQVDVILASLEERKVLERRLNANGSQVFGEKNKLMRHCATGLPVDLFSAVEANWHNYLVCRTGPAESNVRIATEAVKRGWKWNPYGLGFSRGSEVYAVQSEQDAFEFVGLPYLVPEQRM
jgi:DNA polymerase (family 10)